MSIEFNTVCFVGGQKIPAVLRYEKSDPASVAFTFFNADRENSSPTWIFGRELLKDAIENGESGQGDIQMEVVGTRITLMLDSNEGVGMAAFELDVIQQFVEFVYDEVADGDDVYDIPDHLPDEWLV